MWVSLFHASTSDPGYLPRNVPEYDLAIKQVSIEHRDFSSLPQGRIKGPFPNEKYYKIMQNFHFYPFISSPGPKVQVNYCHHLASVVCRL